MILCSLGKTLGSEERYLPLFRKGHRVLSLKTYAVWFYVTLITFITTLRCKMEMTVPTVQDFRED